MNRAELRALTLNWLDDNQSGYFSIPQVNIWLNNAQQEVQKRLIKAGNNYYIKHVQTSLVVNQRNYALPEDFKKIHRLEVVLNGTDPNESVNEIIPITINQQDLVQKGIATPCNYFLSKNNIVVIPAPDTVLTMRMRYSYQVADMTLDTDLPDVPEPYHELISLLAAQDGFIKDGRSSELLMKKIKEYEMDFDSDAQERTQDMPRTIVQTGMDVGIGYWW